jgi:hypothetical protein
MEHISRERLDELVAALRGCGKGRDFCARECGYRGNALCMRRMLEDAAETLETMYDFMAARAAEMAKPKKGAGK